MTSELTAQLDILLSNGWQAFEDSFADMFVTSNNLIQKHNNWPRWNKGLMNKEIDLHMQE